MVPPLMRKVSAPAPSTMPIGSAAVPIVPPDMVTMSLPPSMSMTPSLGVRSARPSTSGVAAAFARTAPPDIVSVSIPSPSENSLLVVKGCTAASPGEQTMSTASIPLRSTETASQALASDGMKTAAVASTDAPPRSNIRSSTIMPHSE